MDPTRPGRPSARRCALGALLLFALVAASCGDNDATTAGDDVGTTTVSAGPPVGDGPYPVADLTVVIRLEGPSGPSTTYRLACRGDTATYTGDSGFLSAPAACLAVAEPAVRDRLLLGAPADRICTEIYGGPQLAGFTGTIDGEPVDTEIDRSDGCGIDDYDILLASLLAPVGG